MFLPLQASAQAPEKMSYQCVVRNTSGILITNQAVGIKISILQGSTSGTVVYTEILTPTTNANGLISIEIGGGTGFDNIDWSEGPYFLKTETDPAGGINYTIIGISQLLSVPYALHAKTAENLTDGIIETDPVFSSSVAGGITGTDTSTWNNKSDFSGNWDDLKNKPAIWDSTYNSIKNTPDLTIYATKDMGNQNIINLADPINLQDATNKVYVDKLFEIIKGIFTGTSVIDLDANIYSTVRIGTQVWMAENLRTTKYNDGTSITKVTENFEWENLTTGAYCWYDNDSATYEIPYGKLYNWYAVYDRTGNKLCPSGWHVPNEEEWAILVNYLGGHYYAGSKLKETGTIHWAPPNRDATNETGFTALPGGFRKSSFTDMRRNGYYWSSTMKEAGRALSIIMNNSSGDINKNNSDLTIGHSVRCVKD